MKYVCLVPGKEKMRWYLDWIRDQLLDLHVDIRLNHAPTVEELRGFDLVLNATGAVSYVPEVVGDARGSSRSRSRWPARRSPASAIRAGGGCASSGPGCCCGATATPRPTPRRSWRASASRSRS